ncbi:MAG TPA: HAMP domain-containing sensor histidine kinase, partial [Dongiaceae bacterium]|nr:HAMP domain-containing sensor histidine kinase [Dongiaceae bacterium]
MKRPRRRGSLLILAASLLVPTLLLCLLGLKLLHDFTTITRNFRTEYGDYIARVSASRVENALWEQEQLNMVAARLDPPQDAREVPAFLKRFGREEYPYYLMPFFVAPEGLIQYSQVDLNRTQAFRPLPHWILEPVLKMLEQNPFRPSGLMHLAAPDSLPPEQVTFFNIHDSSGKLLGALGFIWDLSVIQRSEGIFARALEQPMSDPSVFKSFIFLGGPGGRTDPRSRGIVISLLDDHGVPFYTSASAPGDTTKAGRGFIAERHFSRLLSFYEVGVELREDRFGSWVTSVVRTNLALIGLFFLFTVTAVAFALRLLVHELELAELKSTLVSNVSHELRTPLALIRLFSETLELGRVADPEKAKEFLRIIHKESERLTHLIDNVLDLNRIEQGRKTYTMRPTNLAEVVRETLEAYRFQLQQQGFAVHSRIADNLPPVSADPDALTQALLNLIDNAIKYSPEQKSLSVELERRDGEALISVEDHGVGIPEREQDKIFDMFYRVERGLVHSVKGSGLGLSLVKHIVEAHGGRIQVTSRPGEGSRFSIVLPLTNGG